MINGVSINTVNYNNYSGKLDGHQSSISNVTNSLNMKKSSDINISDEDFYSTMDWYNRLGTVGSNDKDGFIVGTVKEYNKILNELDNYGESTKQQSKDKLELVFKNTAELYASTVAIDINLAHMKLGITYGNKEIKNNDLLDTDTSKQIYNDITQMFFKAKDYYKKNNSFEGITNKYISEGSTTFSYSDIKNVKSYIKHIKDENYDTSGLSDFAKKLMEKAESDNQ